MLYNGGLTVNHETVFKGLSIVQQVKPTNSIIDGTLLFLYYIHLINI